MANSCHIQTLLTAVEMGPGSTNDSVKEAEGSSNEKKLDADLDRIKALDAEKIRLKLNAANGKKFDENARSNGTLREFKEKVAAKVGVSTECAQHLETHLSGYELTPNTKIMRDFTELCDVKACSCCNF